MISTAHAEMLARSGISPERAASRGYETITSKARLTEIGITRDGRRVPGLLIPLRGVDGSVWGHQYRPDDPRTLATGRTVKYETPTDQRNGLDVPPGVGSVLGDPSIPLWITEGTKKADCAAAQGLCCVALLGVWGWRGTNSKGGTTALQDFQDVALKSRQVVICYDSDVQRKPAVRGAMDALATYLAFKGAKVVFCNLPDDGDKTGLDDYLNTHSTEELWTLVSPIASPPRRETPPPINTENTENNASTWGSNPTATAQPPSLEAVQPLAGGLRILDAVATEIRRRGLVGEERLAQTLYLVLTSRLLDKQVSAGVKGHSASGKSHTVDTVCQFFPPEAYYMFTAMSEHALVYSLEDFKHRTMIMRELTAMREGAQDDLTSYFVRTLLSEGRLDYDVTIKHKDLGFITRKITKEGPTNLIFTTTKTRVHAENETRILSLATDDSSEQTARVLTELATENGDSADDLEPWRDFQRWLATAEHRVTIPYGPRLAAMIKPEAVRLRRDFASVLALIRAHAILHQATRDRDDARIVATLDDYAVVRELVSDVIAEGVGATVSDMIRETVLIVGELASDSGVMARDVAGKLGIDKSNAGRRLRVASEGGYILNLEDRRGRPHRWVIDGPLPDRTDILPEPAQLL